MALKEINGQLVVTIDVDEAGYFDVANAALFIELSQSYTRTLAKKGTLAFVVDEDGEMSFHRDTLEAYRASPRHGGRKPGAIPYASLSSVGRKLRSVILMVEAQEDIDAAERDTTVSVLQAMLTASIKSDGEEAE